MFYQVKILDAAGKLKKVISSKSLSNQYTFAAMAEQVSEVAALVDGIISPESENGLEGIESKEIDDLDLATTPEEADLTATALLNDDLVFTGAITFENNVSVLGDLEVTENVFVYDTLVADTIDVASALNVHGDTNLFGNLLVQGDADIKGRLSLSNQQAGLATVVGGGREVVVEYETPFEATPLIQVTPRRDGASNDALPTYWISKTDEKGFTITTDHTVDYDIFFTYLTLPVVDPIEAIGEAEVAVEDSQVLGEQDTQETQGEQQSETVDEPVIEEEPASSPVPTPTLIPTTVPEPFTIPQEGIVPISNPTTLIPTPNI